jgi:hypothetical protein
MVAIIAASAKLWQYGLLPAWIRDWLTLDPIRGN